MSTTLQEQLEAAQAAASSQIQNTEGVQRAETLAPANVETSHAVVSHNPAQPAAMFTMDDAEVVAQSSVAGYIKLRDGGLEINEGKFGPVKFKIKIERNDLGGDFQPVKCMNYNGANKKQVYTKTYDGQKTASNSQEHNGLNWLENVQRILSKDPDAYEYMGYEVKFTVLEDVEATDKSGKVLKAGEVYGYTTPYSASKLLKGLWNKALGEGKRGQFVNVELSGLEVNKGGNLYKVLTLTEI